MFTQSTHDLDGAVQPNIDVQMQVHCPTKFQQHSHTGKPPPRLDVDDLVTSEPNHMISEPNCIISMVDYMI